MEKDKLESKMNPRFLVEEVEGMDCMEERENVGLMIYFVSLLWKSNKKKFSFGRIKGEAVR